MSSAAGSPDSSPQAEAAPRIGPTAEAIKKALKRLCTRGAVPYWVGQKCPELLKLRGVQEVLASLDHPTRVEATATLVAYLQMVIARIEDEEERIVLEVVLGLKEEYLALRKAPERHALAGKLCRGGQDPLAANTIRLRELPRALGKLYTLILEDEGLSSPAETGSGNS